ncbi:MAG: CvpA family protein [Clostridia bacterium]|nr:CvpA family protein [Clostridia bacterium]
MADIIVLLIIAAFAVIGVKRGFIRSVVGVLSFAASIALAWILHPVVSELMMSFGIDITLTERIRESMLGYVTAGGEFTMLPETVRLAVEAGQLEVVNAVAKSAADMAMNIIAFIGVLILSRVVIWIAIRLLNIMSKLPVINGFNRIAGLLLGLVQGVAVVYIALALIFAFAPVGTNDSINEIMEDSSVAILMYDNNPIVDILMPESINQGNGE